MCMFVSVSRCACVQECYVCIDVLCTGYMLFDACTDSCLSPLFTYIYTHIYTHRRRALAQSSLPSQPHPQSTHTHIYTYIYTQTQGTRTVIAPFPPNNNTSYTDDEGDSTFSTDQSSCSPHDSPCPIYSDCDENIPLTRLSNNGRHSSYVHGQDSESKKTVSKRKVRVTPKWLDDFWAVVGPLVGDNEGET